MTTTAPVYKVLPIHLIKPDPDQPRKKGFDDEAMAGMVSTVKEQGVIQDIIVSECDDGTGMHMIVCGERRYRAALTAGIEELMVKIDNVSGPERLKTQLTENLQRVDVDVRDRAAALARYVASQPDQKTAAKSLALSEARISQLLELTQLSPELDELVANKVVRDASTLIMANQLIRRAPEAAAAMIKEATENGKLSRATVAAAMAPFTKRRKKAGATGSDDSSSDSTAQQSSSGSQNKSESPAPTSSLRIEPGTTLDSSDSDGSGQAVIPGFEKVSRGKVAKVKKLLSIDRDIPTDELVAMLVDAYLESAERQKAA